jgi:glycosyltransferase involved in cell wall biosynthesis
MMFSIIIPTHNSNATLTVALRSCLNQTFGDFEIIVIDDASQEPAAKICEGFADPRIVCLRNGFNIGASASRNRGLEAARGDYAVFLDADDVYLPNKLEVLSRAIANGHPDVLLHRQYRLFKTQEGAASWSELPTRSLEPGEPIEEFTFRAGEYYNINVLCVRRRIFEVMRFRPGMRMLEDQAFVFDCVRAAKTVAVLDDLLAVYLDDSRAGRASRRYRTPEDFRAFQDYAQNHLTVRGQALIDATIASELSIFSHPLKVTGALWRGYRAGMAFPRLLFYGFRSIAGARISAALLDLARIATPASPSPKWMSLLYPSQEAEIS